jgi:hypothetical protein
MSAIFRLTFLEVISSMGWVVMLASTILLYFAIPAVSGAHGEGVVISRGQGACAGVFLTGMYCIMLGGKLGAAQVGRGANLYYRSFGIGELPRWLGVGGAAVFPLVASASLAGALLCWNYWSWTGNWAGGFVAVTQFSSLIVMMFFGVVLFTVGLGARFGYGPGVMAGVTLFVVGSFFPQLLSLVVANEPWLEGTWAFLPHLYALDWSPSVIYLWNPAGVGGYFAVFSYGIGWLLILGGVGLGAFSLSPNQNE